MNITPTTLLILTLPSNHFHSNPLYTFLQYLCLPQSLEVLPVFPPSFPALSCQNFYWNRHHCLSKHLHLQEDCQQEKNWQIKKLAWSLVTWQTSYTRALCGHCYLRPINILCLLHFGGLGVFSLLILLV